MWAVLYRATLTTVGHWRSTDFARTEPATPVQCFTPRHGERRGRWAINGYVISKKFADELEELSYQCRHFLNTRSAFTTPAAEDEEEPDENQTTTFDAEAAEDTE